MPRMALDPTKIRAITFDCYGTLIDWEAGVRAYVAPILSAAPLLASLELFQEARLDRIREKSVALTAFLELLLQPLARHVQIITPSEPSRRGCQLSLRILGARTRGRQVLDKLTERGVICDWREPDVIRVAPIPLYNQFVDVFAFSEHLTRVLREIP